MKNGNTLQDTIGNLDIDSVDNITIQLSNLTKKANQLDQQKVNKVELSNYVDNEIASDVTSWLNNNVNPTGSTVMVDSSLSIQGAAADAKTTGNLKDELYYTIKLKAHDAIIIPNNSNINTYTTLGRYKVANTTSAKTMTNLPIQLPGQLLVSSLTGTSIQMQIYIATNNCFYIRGYSDNSFGTWRKLINESDLDELYYTIKLKAHDVIIIPNNSNINTYTTLGRYKVANTTSAETMTNLPIQLPGQLLVSSLTGTSIQMQIYIATNNCFYIRGYSDNSFGTWRKLINESDLDDKINNKRNAVIELPYMSDGYKNEHNISGPRTFSFDETKNCLTVGYKSSLRGGELCNVSSKTSQFNIDATDNDHVFIIDFSQKPYLYIENIKSQDLTTEMNVLLRFQAYSGNQSKIINIYKDDIPKNGLINLIQYLDQYELYNKLEFYGLYANSYTPVEDLNVEITFNFYGVFYENQILKGLSLNDKINNTFYRDQSNLTMAMDALSIKSLIPQYYFAVPDTINDFNANEYLEEKIASIPKGKHFIFLTDTHWDPIAGSERLTSAHFSTKIIQYIRKRTGIQKVVYGGDFLNRGDNKYIANLWVNKYMNELLSAFGTDLIYCHGNHDMNTANIDQVEMSIEDAYERYMIPYEVIYKECFKYLEGVAKFDTNLYSIDSIVNANDKREMKYYNKYHFIYDDDLNKVRYISLYTGTALNGIVRNYTNTYAYGETILQLPWLYNALKTIPEGYDVICIGHQMISPTSYEVYNQSESLAIPVKMMVARKQKKSFTYNVPSRGVYYDAGTITFDFTDSSNIGKIILATGHFHIDHATIFDINDTGDLIGKNPDENNIENGVLGFITQCDAYGQSDVANGAAPMEFGTITEHCFDIVTYNNTGIFFTRIGAGEDRAFFY